MYPGVTMAERPERDGETPHLAALVAAARAHPGEVIVLTGSGEQELARAVNGPPESVAERPGWRIESGPMNRRRLAFLDRDGTVIEDRHYLADPAGVELLPQAAEGLAELSRCGVRLVLLTNQSGIMRGRLSLEQLAEVHRRLVELLGTAGAELSGIYGCPHVPEAGCDCRKPEEGLARRAAKELGLDLSHSVVVGDKGSDLELGHRLGVPAILVGTGEGAATLASGTVVADYLVDDLAGLAMLLRHPAGLPIPVRAAAG